MPVQLGAKPLAEFGRPIEMLIDCHRRIEHFLDVIIRVVERCADGEVDDEGRRALVTAREYFARSAPKHTADEEESLFPRMRSVGIADEEVGQMLAQLQQDHQAADDLHGRLNRLLDEWLASQRPLPEGSVATLRNDLAALKRHYEQHIRLEEQKVFPAASRTLDGNQLREIGVEMRRRRL